MNNIIDEDNYRNNSYLIKIMSLFFLIIAPGWCIGYVAVFHEFMSILFYSVLFNSILFYAIPFYSILSFPKILQCLLGTTDDFRTIPFPLWYGYVY